MKNKACVFNCIRALLIVLLSMFSFISYSQTEDELLTKLSEAQHDTDRIKVYIGLHNVVFKSDGIKAAEYATQILRNAQQSNNLKYELTGYRALAKCGRKDRNYNIVLHYDTLAMIIAKKINTPEALYSVHMDFATDYIDGDQYGNVLPHLNACASIANLQNNDSTRAKVENRLGWYYQAMHQYSKSLPHFENSLLAYQKLKDAKMVAHTRRGYAGSLVRIGRTAKVPDMLFEAISYYQKENSFFNLAHCLAILSEAHLANGNFNMALQNYLEAKRLFKENNYLPDAGSAAADIASFYLTAKNFPKAKQYGLEAQRIMQSINYEYGLITLNTFWGQYYTLSNELDAADLYFKKADRLAKEKGIEDRQTENLRYWAVLKYMQKNKHTGDSLLLLYTERIVKERDPAFITYDINEHIKQYKITDTNIIKSLRTIYSAGGVQKLRDALAGKGSSIAMSADSALIASYSIIPYTADSLKELASNNKLLELETLYKTRIISDSLKLQTQQAIIAKEDSKNKNIIIAAAALLLLLVAVGFSLQYRSRRRAERDKAKIELLQNEIHHRVKNNLAVINRLVEVAGKNSVENAPLLTLKNRIKSIELLHNHLYSNEAKIGNISLQSYFEDLCLAIAATFQTAKDIEIHVKAPTEVDSTIAEKLGLILNELVTNSFKYAFENKEKGAITVIAKPEGKQLNIIVQDNGIGMAAEKSTKSYGMKLIKGLSSELNGKFSFQNTGGTSFQLSIPLSAA